MKRIVDGACGEVSREGKIALIGGIQIKTPEVIDEYFLTKSFKIMNRDGEVVVDLLKELKI